MIKVYHGKPGDGMSYKPMHERFLSETISEVRKSIIESMHDLLKNADDTYWIGLAETVFDRYASQYVLAGGSYEELAKEFPQNF